MFWQAYERRARVIKAGKEVKAWANITAEMMSDEERDGDCFIRHPPSYRSEKLNRFLLKLDERADTKAKTGDARFKRRLGSPREKTVPSGIKGWMTACQEEEESDIDHEHSDSDSDNEHSECLSEEVC